MSTFIDLSGTAHLPDAAELTAGAGSLMHGAAGAGEAIRRAHGKWSLLAAGYAAPEQHQVHSALDRPRHAGEAVLESAARAAAALETFAAAAAGIRRKRLELQGAVEVLLAEERRIARPGLPLPGENNPVSLSGHLLQARADELARELAAAEDECVRTLTALTKRAAGDRSRSAGVYSDTLAFPAP